MKRPKPELYNNRVIYLATRVVSLPLAAVRTIYGGTQVLLEVQKSPKQHRARNQVRQSAVRRNLRGLATDHVQEPAKPA